jgi:transcriptional regulator with XRE-family HTH domain
VKLYIRRFIELREDNDLTQKQLAEVLNKSQQGYTHIENGRANLSVDDMTTLCKFYNISPEYILGFTNEIKKLDNK